MKFFFIIIVLMGFSGAILFGAFLMVHSGSAESHASCLPTLMRKGVCKTNINPLEYARVHLGALTELANIIPAFGATAALAALIILLYTARILGFCYGQLFALRERYFPSCENAWQVVQEKFFSWTALHEKRDPSFAFAPGA